MHFRAFLYKKISEKLLLFTNFTLSFFISKIFGQKVPNLGAIRAHVYYSIRNWSIRNWGSDFQFLKVSKFLLWEGLTHSLSFL